MIRDLFEGPHLVILIVVCVALFGWKRLPDAARSLGRSMRIFKTEIEEMKNDSQDMSGAVRGDSPKVETVQPTPDPIPQQAAEPRDRETHS
jgi:sec-independent protein translocase protein TatA